VPQGNAPERRLISGTLITITERTFAAGERGDVEWEAGTAYHAWLKTDAGDIEVRLTNEEMADDLQAMPKGATIYVVVNAWPRFDDKNKPLPPELKATSITQAT
jgi:hypothetical protein